MAKDEKFPSDAADRFQVRMPEGLRDRIRRHAEANNRSMNAEVVFLLESGLWEADQMRLEGGLEPLREMTETDIARLAYYRDIVQRQKERKEAPPPQIADLDVPFFDDGPTQREMYAEIFARLDRIEKKLDRP